MQEKLDKIIQGAKTELDKAESTKEINEIRQQNLGKKGAFTQLLKGLGALSPEERPQAGKVINEARMMFESMLSEQEKKIKSLEKQVRLSLETIDVTLPGEKSSLGSAHPLSLVRDEIENIFISMGFEIAEGPEIELDHFNFELLNVPKGHPARDMQDSFYIDDNKLLRTHTSPVQARTMTTQKPPIRIICPGRVYRFDEVDATHSPVFHQCEGLVVDRGITMAHLRGTLEVFAKRMYGKNVKTRLRPSFFPFTEPSAEMDVSCYLCGGDDPNCRVCKGGGWIEILGCGMVNPNVLKMCGIDPDIYSGFAFGMGIDRITTSRYTISDLRTLFENDMRFLKQFQGL
ncbi:MAG: phenylalanine--tRNA ligase subunit alpha [Eubacteriales bacterium]